jgi:threonine/homoserine/homoserine lactone efflux protein
MTFNRWLEFALASALMGLLPGPAVMSICGYALCSGSRVAVAAVMGSALGNLIAMSLSLAGVGALLSTSAMAFTVLKWAGAAYLIALGSLTIARSGRATEADASSPPVEAGTAFRSQLALGTFHPKTILFFVAFAPQFIDPRQSYALQASLLIATFVGIVASTDMLYALLASRASNLLRAPHTTRWMRRAGGGVLLAAGAVTALSRR